MLSGYETNFSANHRRAIVVNTNKTELFKVGMIYSGSVLWNNLPITLKSTKSISAFKKHYENNFLSDPVIH